MFKAVLCCHLLEDRKHQPKVTKKGTKKVRITTLTYKEQKQNRFHHITELKVAVVSQ